MPAWAACTAGSRCAPLGVQIETACALESAAEIAAIPDVDLLFVPVLGHRLMLAPSYLAETRNLTRDEVLQRIRQQCLERVPAPRPDWVADFAAS